MQKIAEQPLPHQHPATGQGNGPCQAWLLLNQLKQRGFQRNVEGVEAS